MGDYQAAEKALKRPFETAEPSRGLLGANGKDQ
jgi:hypothetical protein